MERNAENFTKKSPTFLKSRTFYFASHLFFSNNQNIYFKKNITFNFAFQIIQNLQVFFVIIYDIYAFSFF